MKKDPKSTLRACFIAYIAGAIINNFVPLLFVTLQDSYAIPLSQITLLITVNFAVQILTDLVSAWFIDRIGYRAAVVGAHICSCAGLALLTVLPELLPDPFAGIVCCIVIYAVGGGLLEVLISPITEACPSENKEKAMSLLHSFYCWGHVGVVLVSTAFFAVFSTANWKLLALIWALVPAANAVYFSQVPLYRLNPEGEDGVKLGKLLKDKLFWVLLMMMLCAGASEQAVSQWASAFAERGLGVSKTLGDLAGPMAFALLMGTSRLIYGKWGHRLDLDRFIRYSCLLCVGAYLCIALVPSPVAGLVGCGICGFSVGIFWPGTFSKAAATLRRGGTAMFAFLALAGDAGCSLGPTLAGLVSSRFGDDLRVGILAAVGFPVLLLAGSLVLGKGKGKSKMDDGDCHTILRDGSQ